MNAYMGYDEVAGSGEAACLVFAATARDAKKLVYPVLRDWLNTEWMDARAKRLRENLEHLISQGDQEKLAAGVAHVIETPETCPHCDKWGGGEPGEDGRCDFCHDDDE